MERKGEEERRRQVRRMKRKGKEEKEMKRSKEKRNARIYRP